MRGMAAHQALEHSEHIAHAGGHGGHGDHGAEQGHLGLYIGITMAILGVLLAFCAAKVGAERTELVQTLVEQQNAHAKYQAQDVKHRVAFLQLQAVHATIAGGANPDKKDLAFMADTVDRYLKESAVAKEWVESYEPAIKAHVHGQEHYELGQLLAEIGIVVASVALLLKRKVAWFGALALGLGAVGVTAWTYFGTGSQVHHIEHDIEEKAKIYRDMRNADKTTAQENDLLAEVRKWAGAPAPAPAAPAPATAHHE
jgi:hypothetical protein